MSLLENPAQPGASTFPSESRLFSAEGFRRHQWGWGCRRDRVLLRCFIDFLGDADGSEADLHMAETPVKDLSGLRIPFSHTPGSSIPRAFQKVYSGDPRGRGRPGSPGVPKCCRLTSGQCWLAYCSLAKPQCPHLQNVDTQKCRPLQGRGENQMHTGMRVA